MCKLAAAAALALLGVASISRADISIDDLVRDAGLEAGAIATRDLPRWRGARKVLVVGVDREELDAVRALLPDTRFVVPDSPEDALTEVVDADAVLGTCDPDLVAAAANLVWIQIFAAGAERCVTLPRIASGEIVLTNMQKMSAPVIGEHAVAMALAIARGLPAFAKRMPAGEWRRGPEATASMVPLSGRTMLVVGLGGIGSEAAKRAKALGMRVVATRNSSREGPPWVDYVGLSDELADLAGDADVIVNALPLTDTTRGLMDEAFFRALRQGAIFINVGRGATVDTEALLDALRSGRLRGAGLDVTDPEPLPPDHPLWQLESVIITPHVSWRGGETERHRVLRKENLRRYAAGEALLNVVDPDKGY